MLLTSMSASVMGADVHIIIQPVEMRWPVVQGPDALFTTPHRTANGLLAGNQYRHGVTFKEQTKTEAVEPFRVTLLASHVPRHFVCRPDVHHRARTNHYGLAWCTENKQRTLFAHSLTSATTKLERIAFVRGGGSSQFFKSGGKTGLQPLGEIF